MERLRSIELRMSEIQAKASSLGITDAGAQFRQVLERETISAVATTANQGLAGSRLAPSTFASHGMHAAAQGALRPSAELMAWGNGRIPPSLLVPIGQSDHRLAPDAAVAFKAMAADARRDGVVLSVSDSYRSLEEQAQLVETHGHYDEGGFAAQPGSSAHGWGLAVDLDLDGRALTWMRANGAKYGFAEDVPREPWHWTYRPHDAGNRASGSTKGFW